MQPASSNTNEPTAASYLPLEVGYSLAGGMLRQDLSFIVPLYALTILPSLVATFAGEAEVLSGMGLSLTERITELLFLYFVSRHWVRKLRISSVTQRANLPAFLAFGVAVWLLFAVPVAAQLVEIPDVAKLVFVLLLIPATILGLRYFFYFFPLVTGVRGMRAVLKSTAFFTATYRGLVYYCLVGPLAVLSLLCSLLMALSPDGRYGALLYVWDFVGGLFWVFSTYLALAFALLTLPKEQWHLYGLDPAKLPQLQIVAEDAPSWLSAALKPRNSLIILAVSALVWLGNYSTLAQMAPSPRFEVLEIIVHDRTLKLRLSAEDEEFRFRGFRPLHFALAGEKRALVAEMPRKVTLADSPLDVRLTFPNGIEKGVLELEFETDRPAQELAALEDLFLWYRHAKLLRLDMKSTQQG